MKRTFVEISFAVAGIALLITAMVYAPAQPSFAAPALAITGTPTEPPTDTPVPPTDTPVPPTDTPVPPTDTPVGPTNTSVPPTDTPVSPTDTPVPLTDTPVPPTRPPSREREKTSTPTATLTPTLTPEPPTNTLEPATPVPPTPTRIPALLPNTGAGDGGSPGRSLPLAVLGLGAIGVSVLLRLRRRSA